MADSVGDEVAADIETVIHDMEHSRAAVNRRNRRRNRRLPCFLVELHGGNREEDI